jgi:FkbM family methyltransferase
VTVAEAVKSVARRAGLDVRRYAPGRSPRARRQRALEQEGIDLVVDVGANVGQYARAIRSDGYRGPIVSFEPLEDAYASLEAAAKGDDLWETRQLALGARTGRATIHVAGNSISSSLLEIDDRHLRASQASATLGDEQVAISRLDDVSNEALGPARRALLKLDVQGLELEVLKGATATMRRVAAAEIEMSLVELYSGQPLAPVVFEHVLRSGFECVGLEPCWADPHTGYVLQVDGLFVRRESG